MGPKNIDDYKGEFFRVLGQTDLSQVAFMTVRVGSDSGAYGLHQGDQVVYIIEGEGELEVGEERWEMKKGDVCIIPKKTRHKIYNKGDNQLVFLNVYTPPEY